MKSQTITIRLRAEELEALDKLCQSPVSGHVTRTEKLRQLILLATAKNAHEPAPTVHRWQREYRTGRPLKPMTVEACNMKSFDSANR